jgi:hypothetical protein
LIRIDVNTHVLSPVETRFDFPIWSFSWPIPPPFVASLLHLPLQDGRILPGN